MLLPRRAFWELRAGVMGHLFSVALECRTQAQRKLMRRFKIQTRSLRFLDTAFWVTSPGTGPSTHLEPITCTLARAPGWPVTQNGNVPTGHKKRAPLTHPPAASWPVSGARGIELRKLL